MLFKSWLFQFLKDINEVIQQIFMRPMKMIRSDVQEKIIFSFSSIHFLPKIHQMRFVYLKAITSFSRVPLATIYNGLRWSGKWENMSQRHFPEEPFCMPRCSDLKQIKKWSETHDMWVEMTKLDLGTQISWNYFEISVVRRQKNEKRKMRSQLYQITSWERDGE